MSTPLGADYPRTYRMAWWARALAIVLGLLLAASPLGLVALGAFDRRADMAPLLLVALALAVPGVYLIVSAWRSKIVLTADAIELHGPLRVRRLARAEIAGRRLIPLNYGQTMTLLVPSGAGAKPLRLSQTSIRTDGVFAAWIAGLPDLDAKDAAASEAEVAADPELGATPEERLARLAQARKVATVLGAVTWGVCIWCFAYPKPYLAAVGSAAILPWAALLLVARSAGLYRLDTQRNDVRPQLSAALYLPGFALLIRAVQDVGVLDWQRALGFGVLTAGVLAWAALMSDATLRTRRAAALGLLALSGAYGYGAVVLGNSAFDRDPGNRYQVTVLNHHVSHGKSTSYYLRLAPWGPRHEPKDVSVTRGLYAQARPGGNVCVHQGPGALGISWFVVKACG